MCNEFDPIKQWEEYSEMMAKLELGIPVDQGPADLFAKGSVHISEAAPVIVTRGNLVALAPMRFGFPPERGRGPVFNFRSEGRSFASANRCLVPAAAFFEFTGTRSPKTRHRFTAAQWPFLAIAGLWRDYPTGPAFAMLTTEPGPDIAPIHDRQIVILPPEQWAAWLALSKPEAELLVPAPAGTLAHEVVAPGGPLASKRSRTGTGMDAADTAARIDRISKKR